MLRKKLLLGALSVSLLTVAACGGGGARTETNVKTTTVGQELTDLNAAYESGVISKEEYEKKRKEILGN